MKSIRLLAMLMLCAVAAPLAAQTSYVDGDAEAGKGKAQQCAACHGAQGNSNNPQWPNLAGQHPKYIFNQLKYFKSGKRQNSIMAGQVANLSEQDMRDLAAYFGTLEMAVGEASEEAVKTGQSIYRGGLPAKNVPACAACHGPAGGGNPGVAYPHIGGQKATYLANALQQYRAGKRAGYGQAAVMNTVAQKLSDEEIQAVASFVSGLYRRDSAQQ